jgi:hypothetical protein
MSVGCTLYNVHLILQLSYDDDCMNFLGYEHFKLICTCIV